MCVKIFLLEYRTKNGNLIKQYASHEIVKKQEINFFFVCLWISKILETQLEVMTDEVFHFHLQNKKDISRLEFLAKLTKHKMNVYCVSMVVCLLINVNLD